MLSLFTKFISIHKSYLIFDVRSFFMPLVNPITTFLRNYSWYYIFTIYAIKIPDIQLYMCVAMYCFNPYFGFWKSSYSTSSNTRAHTHSRTHIYERYLECNYLPRYIDIFNTKVRIRIWICAWIPQRTTCTCTCVCV